MKPILRALCPTCGRAIGAVFTTDGGHEWRASVRINGDHEKADLGLSWWPTTGWRTRMVAIPIDLGMPDLTGVLLAGCSAGHGITVAVRELQEAVHARQSVITPTDTPWETLHPR